VRATESVADLAAVHGLAHVSGGGVRNLVRLNRKVRFVLDGWPEPSGIFEWARASGRISLEELYQTFNVGIGFVLVVSAKGEGEVLRRLRRSGSRDARRIGRIERGTGVELPHQKLRYSGYA
jgi:phosphoribosylformylglycinamidine cyclo-ligase